MQVAVYTSIVSTILLALILKGLHYFHLVNWDPVSFIKNSQMFSDGSTFGRWALFLLLLFVLTLILYLASQYIFFIPPSLSSLVVGLIIAILVEWRIYDLALEMTSFKKLSIPFIVVILMFTRFIMETSGYHKKAKYLESRNKLPYKSDMIK